MSARELIRALEELLRSVPDSGDTNLWIDDGSLRSFSFEGREIDGELQGVLAPELGSEPFWDPEGWRPIEGSVLPVGELVDVARSVRYSEGVEVVSRCLVTETGIGIHGAMYWRSSRGPLALRRKQAG